MRHKTVLIVSLFAALFPGMGAVCLAGFPTDTLDQSQTNTESWGWIGNGTERAQIFTVGLYGSLDRVSVYLENDATIPATGPITVSVQTISGYFPSGIALSTGTIPLSAIPPAASPGWVDVRLSPKLVTAGTQYALVLSTDAGRVRWYEYARWGDIYLQGYLVESFGHGWNERVGHDAAFKTFVVGDSLDRSQELWNRNNLVGGGQQVAQIFTAGLYGMLDRVSVLLSQYSPNPATGPIMVSVRKVSLGQPDLEEVSSQTIPPSAVPTEGPGWVNVPMGGKVRAGTQYAIVLSSSSGYVRWHDWTDNGGTDIYSGGDELTSYGTVWNSLPFHHDTAFKTYVLADNLDQAYTQWSGRYEYVGFGNNQIGQVFRAGQSGILDRVSVRLDNEGAGCPIQVRITAVAGGLPSDLEIGSGEIPVSNIPHGDWVDVNISGPTVVADTFYALVLSLNCAGGALWYVSGSAGGGVYNDGGTGWDNQWRAFSTDYKIYVIPVVQIARLAGPAITPCSYGVCPSVSGGFTKADSTEGVASQFRFQERPDGTVMGILNFTDPGPDGIALHGCTTESAACALNVTSFACTDQHTMIIRGTYSPKKGFDTQYQLTLSGVSDDNGTFVLDSGEYNYTLTHPGIVDVTCPPVPTP